MFSMTVTNISHIYVRTLFKQIMVESHPLEDFTYIIQTVSRQSRYPFWSYLGKLWHKQIAIVVLTHVKVKAKV